MLIVDKLPFPNGVATGETLKEIYSAGGEAIARVKMLVAGMGLGIVTKVINLVFKIGKLTIPGNLGVQTGGVMAGKGFKTLTFKNNLRRT